MNNHVDNVWSWSQDDDGAFVVKDSCRRAVAYDISLFRDANLIASAPELLEALEAYHKAYDENPHLGPRGSQVAQAFIMARAALAKAKGEAK